MRYAVWADLPRELTEEERSTVFEALDRSVPGSGCVGRDKGATDAVYFCVEAVSEDEARTQAANCMNMLLRRAKVDISYTLYLQVASTA